MKKKRIEFNSCFQNLFKMEAGKYIYKELAILIIFLIINNILTKQMYKCTSLYCNCSGKYFLSFNVHLTKPLFSLYEILFSTKN